MSARRVLFGAALALGWGLAGGAGAATIPYSSCVGNTVQYTNIAESSADAPLYNQPTCVGDVLDFDPLGFEANSQTSNPDFVDGNLVFQVDALSGFTLDNLILDENGDWQAFGFEPSNTQASVTLTVRLEILIAGSGGPLELEYARRTSLLFDSATTNPIDVWQIHEEFLMASIFADACSGSGFFDPTTGGLTGTGGTGAISDACGATTTTVGVNIDNTLFAFAESGELAFINKKDFDGLTLTTETEPIPEPGTAGLLALGLALLARRRRR